MGIQKVCVVLVAALALLAGASAAGAGTVRMTTCINGQGAATTTPGPLQLSLGWATWTPQLTEKFLGVQSVTYVVDGGSTTTATGDLTGWGAITPALDADGNTLYSTRYTTPVVADLEAGESVTVSLVFSTTKRVWDNARDHYGPGELFAPITCTITAL